MQFRTNKVEVLRTAKMLKGLVTAEEFDFLESLKVFGTLVFLCSKFGAKGTWFAAIKVLEFVEDLRFGYQMLQVIKESRVFSNDDISVSAVPEALSIHDSEDLDTKTIVVISPLIDDAEQLALNNFEHKEDPETGKTVYSNEGDITVLPVAVTEVQHLLRLVGNPSLLVSVPENYEAYFSSYEALLPVIRVLLKSGELTIVWGK